MAIVFTKIHPRDPEAVPVRSMGEPHADLRACEEALLDFLCSLRTGEPQTGPILWPDSTVCASLISKPPASLIGAFGLCLDDLLGEIGPDNGDWRSLTMTTAVFGAALAAYNALCEEPMDEAAIGDVLSLVHSLPPAISVADALGYHAVLRHVAGHIGSAVPHRDAILRPLVDLCPLTGVLALERIAPAPLADLAAELLPGWTIEPVARSPWISADNWVDAISTLIDAPFIGRYLRLRWLALPSDTAACRNLGLVLESLRRHGRHGEFLFAFYEAYEYFRAVWPSEDPQRRHWAVLDEIARLLSATDTPEPRLALRLQRRAGSRFLLFRPLLQLVICEGGVPASLTRLRDLPIAAAHCMDIMADLSQPVPINMSDVQFGED